MKRYSVLFAAFLIAFEVFSQNTSVSIGHDQPKTNSVLFLYSSNHDQGLLIPVSDRTKISSPESGMVVFDQTDKAIYYHNGTQWIMIGATSGSSTTNLKIDVAGNTIRLLDGATSLSSAPLASNSPSASQVLSWNGSSWTATSLTGDVTNSTGTVQVRGILGKGLPALPATSQALIYNGTSWVFQPLSSIANVSGTTPIVVTNGASSPLISINQSNTTQDGYLSSTDWNTFNNKLGSGSSAGGDLSGTYPNPTVSGLRGRSISNVAPTNGQVLKWNSTTNLWEAQDDNAGGGSVPTLSPGDVLVGDGTTNSAKPLSGDATINSTTGAITVANLAITTPKIADLAITTAKIADAAVTDAKIVTVSASKVTGITTNYLPRANATGLVNSQIRDDGSTVGVGIAPNPAYKLYIDNGIKDNGLYVSTYYPSSAGATLTGIATITAGGTIQNIGINGQANNANNALGYGIKGIGIGTLTSTADCFGIYGGATSALGNNYGVYGDVGGTNSGIKNYGGYFKTGGHASATYSAGITSEVYAASTTNVGDMAGLSVTISKTATQVGLNYLMKGAYLTAPNANLTLPANNRYGLYIEKEQYNYLSGRLTVGNANHGMGNLQVQQGTNSATDGIWLGDGTSTYSLWIDGATQNLTLRKIGTGMIGSFDKTTGVYTNVSDRRRKKEIEPLPTVLGNIQLLKPSKYLFTNQNELEEKNIGFIAQEVKAIFPSLVKYNAKDDLYSLDYSGFSVLAIKAIQEQQQIIASQEKLINQLQERLLKFENSVGSIEDLKTEMNELKKLLAKGGSTAIEKNTHGK